MKVAWKSFQPKCYKIYYICVNLLTFFTVNYIYKTILISNYGKGVKFISRLTKHLNAYKGYLNLKSPHESPQYKFHKEKNTLGGNWEDDKYNLLAKTVTSTSTNGILEILTEDKYQKRLFTSELLLALREEKFSSHEFSTSILISNKKLKYLRLKHKSSFYPFNNQLHYDLVNYSAESEIIKGNVNKLFINPFIEPLTKKLSYNNTDERMEKL